MQATDGVFGPLWINYIFNEFGRLRNKICRKICKCQILVVSLCRNSKNNQIMEQQITFDKRNYRKHSEKNKAIIRKSLQELGAGRFVLKEGGRKLERCKMSEAEWMREFERLFELTDSFGWKIFGVNTESSRWSCHVGHPFQLRGYVLASCMGIINDGTLYFDEAFRVKEDYEISLRHVQRFGGIVRAEYMYFENEHWTGDGGCKDYRTDELERDCINRLIQLYPRFIRNVSNKSSQYTIKLHFD